MKFKSLLVVALAAIAIGNAGAQQILSPLDGLPTLKHFKAMRASSSDANWVNGNGDARPIAPGKTLVLGDLTGPGRVAHIWFTIADNEPQYGKKLVLRMFWDGEKTPSVEAPLNDFFCQGHGIDLKVNSFPFRVTSNGRGRNCYFPMPFRKSARIEVTNEGKQNCGAFYYYIDWQKFEDLPKDTAYFHAKYRQEFPCVSGKNYLILAANGQGHYVGCNLSIRLHEDGWWGEGDDFFFIDGEKEPSLRGTGSEDYFCDGWGLRELDGLFYGVPLMEGEGNMDRVTAYRFHIQDPVPFTKSIKVEIEHKGARRYSDGKWNGFVERADDFSSVAYWYQIEPHVEYAKLPPVEERLYSNASEIIGASLMATAETDGPKPQGQDVMGVNQLFFTPQDDKSAITVKFPIKEAGNYDLRLTLTKSWDYGVYQCYLDGAPVGRPQDLYSGDIAPLRVRLGRHDLAAGTHALKFVASGKNSASRGYFFGLQTITPIPMGKG